MEFKDYYFVFNVPVNASMQAIQQAFEKKIAALAPSDEAFASLAEAYSTLHNRYKRFRYDRLRGHLMVIQKTPWPYASALCYTLNPNKVYGSFQRLIQKFKDFIAAYEQLDWAEAQAARYFYAVETNDHEENYLLLRFPVRRSLEKFANLLMQEKWVK